MMLDQFSQTYSLAMREAMPREWNRLVRSGQIRQHLRQKTREAEALLEDLCRGMPLGPNGRPTDLNAYRCAVEQVLAVMLDFPPE